DKSDAVLRKLKGRENSAVLDSLAAWCVLEGESETAIKLYELKLEKAPGSLETWFQLAQAYQSAGQTDAVFATLARGSGAVPATIVSQYAQRSGTFLQNSKLT